MGEFIYGGGCWCVGVREWVGEGGGIGAYGHV